MTSRQSTSRSSMVFMTPVRMLNEEKFRQRVIGSFSSVLNPRTVQYNRVEEVKRVAQACCTMRTRSRPKPPSASALQIPSSKPAAFDRPRFLQKYGHLLHGDNKWREEICREQYEEEERLLKPLDAWLQDSKSERMTTGKRQGERNPRINCKSCQTNVRTELMRCLKNHSCLSHYILPAVAVDVMITGIEHQQPKHNAWRRACRLVRAVGAAAATVSKEEGKGERSVQTSRFLFGRHGPEEIEPGQLLSPTEISNYRHSMVLGMPSAKTGAAVLDSFLPSKKAKMLRLLMPLSAVGVKESALPSRRENCADLAQSGTLVADRPQSSHLSSAYLKIEEENTKTLEKLITLLVHFPSIIQLVKARHHAYKIWHTDHVCSPACFVVRAHKQQYIDHTSLFKQVVTLIKSLRSQPDLLERILDGYEKIMSPDT